MVVGLVGMLVLAAAAAGAAGAASGSRMGGGEGGGGGGGGRCIAILKREPRREAPARACHGSAGGA